jgi:ComF family protein
MDCQRQARSFTHCVAPWLYGKPISTFLKQFKFTADMHVLPLLSHLLVNAVRQDIETHGAPDLVLPVPIHWWRLVRRGFNHAELLAKDLSSHPSIHPCQLQVKPSWCKKIRLTAAQHDLGLAQRKSNLAGVFSCDDRVAGLSVAIVDDVITTGATAENVSCALLAAGAQQVRVWCLARTPNPS